MAVERAGKSSETMTAEALVLRAAGTYLGFETNVSCPSPAVSMPATPVISVSGKPFSRRAPRVEAISESFMEAADDCNGGKQNHPEGSERPARYLENSILRVP